MRAYSYLFTPLSQLLNIKVITMAQSKKSLSEQEKTEKE